jgi:hypothetical protein
MIWKYVDLASGLVFLQILGVCTPSSINDYWVKILTLDVLKGIVSKLMIKFWMSQKCGKMKDYNVQQQKMTTSTVEWLQHTGYGITL